MQRLTLSIAFSTAISVLASPTVCWAISCTVNRPVQLYFYYWTGSSRRWWFENEMRHAKIEISPGNSGEWTKASAGGRQGYVLTKDVDSLTCPKEAPTTAAGLSASSLAYQRTPEWRHCLEVITEDMGTSNSASEPRSWLSQFPDKACTFLFTVFHTPQQAAAAADDAHATLLNRKGHGIANMQQTQGSEQASVTSVWNCPNGNTDSIVTVDPSHNFVEQDDRSTLFTCRQMYVDGRQAPITTTSDCNLPLVAQAAANTILRQSVKFHGDTVVFGGVVLNSANSDVGSGAQPVQQLKHENRRL